jgi:hypothetical protein
VGTVGVQAIVPVHSKARPFGSGMLANVGLPHVLARPIVLSNGRGDDDGLGAATWHKPGPAVHCRTNEASHNDAMCAAVPAYACACTAVSRRGTLPAIDFLETTSHQLRLVPVGEAGGFSERSHALLVRNRAIGSTGSGGNRPPLTADCHTMKSPAGH